MRTQRLKTALAGLLLAGLAFAAGAAVAAGGGANQAQDTHGAKRVLTEVEVAALIRELAPEYDGRASPSLVGCAILDAQGRFVREVQTTDIGEPAYFLEYMAQDTFSNRVELMTVPLFTGSPLTRQTQTFEFDSDDTDVITPFGVPTWALDLTTGPWALVVRSDVGGVAVCRFMVVP